MIETAGIRRGLQRKLALKPSRGSGAAMACIVDHIAGSD
jgi:hypothetical protein